MAGTINIHEAKTHLSRIIEEVVAGNEVVIARAGKPMVRLVPITPLARPKKLGLLRGRVRVPDDFNAPLPGGILETFSAC